MVLVLVIVMLLTGVMFCFALVPRFDNLVGHHHNEVHDAIGDLASIAWGNVIREPVVCEAPVSSSNGALVADLCVHGMWSHSSCCSMASDCWLTFVC